MTGTVQLEQSASKFHTSHLNNIPDHTTVLAFAREEAVRARTQQKHPFEFKENPRLACGCRTTCTTVRYGTNEFLGTLLNSEKNFGIPPPQRRLLICSSARTTPQHSVPCYSSTHKHMAERGLGKGIQKQGLKQYVRVEAVQDLVHRLDFAGLHDNCSASVSIHSVASSSCWKHTRHAGSHLPQTHTHTHARTPKFHRPMSKSVLLAHLFFSSFSET